MTPPVLALERVTYAYPGAATPALADVTISVAPGELVVIAGDSGSGKSTLLRVASGLVPHFHGGVFAGRAAIAGLELRQHGAAALAGTVGTVLQDPEAQVVMSTARAELALGLENRRLSAAAVARAVEEAALALGIAHLLDRSTAELSGGELQRVALAAALAGRPPLLVLDEPTSQLDPVAGDELLATLRRWNQDADVALLLAEHRLERCLEWADRVIAMSGGRIVCDAPPAEFLAWAGSAAPQLTTPGARLLGGLGLRPVPGVRAARRALRAAGVPLAHGAGADLALGNAAGAVAATGGAAATPGAAAAGPGVTARALRASPQPPALTLDRTWCEIRHGPAILRGVSLSVGAGERLALMGRNGAGKSTLLRCAAGLAKPTRGSLRAAGRVALLLQNPTDYLVHDTVGEEASAAALEAAGLDRALCSRHPRDLSGGERQRLALAVVLDGGTERAEQLAVVCLDEPTRGMDRARKEELAGWLRRMGLAVIVATHDTEFAAAFAQRVVLLGEGTVIADGPVSDVLTGGAYFVTETARILGGAGGALTAEDGIALLSGRSSADERSRLRPPEEVVA